MSMWESESETGGGRDYGNGVLSTSKHGLKTDGFEQRGQSWYVCMTCFSICLHLCINILSSSFCFWQKASFKYL